MFALFFVIGLIVIFIIMFRFLKKTRLALILLTTGIIATSETNSLIQHINEKNWTENGKYYFELEKGLGAPGRGTLLYLKNTDTKKTVWTSEFLEFGQKHFQDIDGNGTSELIWKSSPFPFIDQPVENCRIMIYTINKNRNITLKSNEIRECF